MEGSLSSNNKEIRQEMGELSNASICCKSGSSGMQRFMQQEVANNKHAAEMECLPVPAQIELVLIEETFSEGNGLDECCYIKQEAEDCNDPILTALIDSDSEEDINLLDLINCAKRKSDEITTKTENLPKNITNLRYSTQKKVNSKKKSNITPVSESAEGSYDTNTYTLMNRLTENNKCNIERNNKNKPDYLDSEESDHLQEFIEPVESKKSKCRSGRKRQLTKEQKAEKEQKQLERRTCIICSIVFAFPGGLRDHVRSKHTHEKPYTCEFCGEQFSIQSSYALHKRRHLGIKPHLCSLCGKTFLRKVDMRIHMQVHVPSEDKIRNVKCSFCSNTYTSKINLRKHVLTKHTDPSDWKHECSICHKKCFSATDLTHHTWQHNDDRKFKCVICDRGFFTKQSMNVHVRTHSASTAFNCKHCSNGYRSNEALQHHLLKVHGLGEEKPSSAPKYFCSVCQKGFRQRARLEQHLVLHEIGTEEYPFECKQCDKRYKARNYFTIHMMDKHNIFINDDYFRTHFNSNACNNWANLGDTIDVSNKNPCNK